LPAYCCLLSMLLIVAVRARIKLVLPVGKRGEDPKDVAWSGDAQG